MLVHIAGASDNVQPSRLPASCQGSGAALYRPWPPEMELAPGAELHWPVWLHPTGTGNLRVQFVWYYEPVVGGSLAAVDLTTVGIMQTHILLLLGYRYRICCTTPIMQAFSWCLLVLAVCWCRFQCQVLQAQVL